MSALLGKKAEDIPDIDLDNLDDLLQALTHEELEELNGDFDPDVRVLAWNFCYHHCCITSAILALATLKEVN